ncbi:MAG: mycothiol synthase [Actinomycetales bacterium]|nr:MAG: mycothiol synthase [Actinomycetales bacterium]
MSFIEDLARAAHDVDGVAPFNEATLLALTAGDEPRIHLVDETSAAIAFGDAPVELVVHPEHRRRGIGRELLERTLVADATDFWAHGELPGARALATSAGLSPARTLLVLRLSLGDEAPVEQVPEGVTLRAFRPDDTDAVVAVNGRAFATHPEQGAMDRADFQRRASSDWFDPEGLFVAERDGQVVGFHWTKVEDAPDGERRGEVYVVGVDPSAHGGGLGSALTARGLRFMHEQGIRTVDLYVEADNEPALRTYGRLGFVEHARDTLFTTPER